MSLKQNDEQTVIHLSANRVSDIFIDCLFKEGEDTSNHVAVEGVGCRVGLHPQRLEQHKSEISLMLKDLDDKFQASGGGGMSFLNACNDKHGNQWTGMQKTMDELFMLGVAAQLAKPVMPREMWHALPGGMPYYVVL